MATEGIFPLRPITDFACRTSSCPDFGVRGGDNLHFCGTSGHKGRIRMVRCKTCKHRFSERTGTALAYCHLPDQKASLVLRLAKEGLGIRASSRVSSAHRDSVSRLRKKAGEHSLASHDELIPLSPPDPRAAVRRAPRLRPHPGPPPRSR